MLGLNWVYWVKNHKMSNIFDKFVANYQRQPHTIALSWRAKLHIHIRTFWKAVEVECLQEQKAKKKVL